jgi:hypothetical protein
MERPVIQPRWQEWITLILGAWVFVSPWIFGFTASQAITLNYLIVGAVMFVCSGAAIARNESAEWISLIAAVWLASIAVDTGLHGYGRAQGRCDPRRHPRRRLRRLGPCAA